MKHRLFFISYSTIKSINSRLSLRTFSSKVPVTPVKTLEKQESTRVRVDKNTLALLERLSLVKCDTEEGVKVLEDSIAFADKVLHINTDNVEPLYSVLENESLSLRNDVITQGNCQKDILKNATVVEDDYFVSPPGNIPLHEIEVEERSANTKKMRTELQRVINLKNYFKIINSSTTHVGYNFKEPSKVLLHNIYVNWLKAISTKSTKHFPVYVNKNLKDLKTKTLPFGIINECTPNWQDISIQHRLSQYAPDKKTRLNLNLYIPKPDAMQYFIQWQRLRKYWWSSITTTPSLFSINEVKCVDETSDVDIVAQFPWGPEVVETVTLDNRDTVMKNALNISCSTTLEGALFVLLLDGQNNPNKSHLRLHRKMTPYKMSFALDYKDLENKETLNELAILLYNMLESKKISTWLPDFALSMESQIKENLLMGVAYTAVISERTLSNGIMHVYNSNTTLKEQVHIADLSSYAALLFQK